MLTLSLTGAMIQGAMDGLRLAAGISELLIAVLGLVGLIDKLRGFLKLLVGNIAEPETMKSS